MFYIKLLLIDEAEKLIDTNCDNCQRIIKRAKQENKKAVLFSSEGHIVTENEAEILLRNSDYVTDNLKDDFILMLIESIKENKKGQFVDEAGNICWYLDALVEEIRSNLTKAD